MDPTTELIIERIDTLDTNLKEYVSMCQMNCGSKLDAIGANFLELNKRIDHCEDSIFKIESDKNLFRGAMIVVVFVLGWIGFNWFEGKL